MTEYRIRRLRIKIQESRSRLMSSHPFFALLLMYLRFIAVPGMKKISTNGRCIFFSPDFTDKLYWYELDFVLSHQIMHIILGHIWRAEDFVGDNYHLACDILVNQQLAAHGFVDEKYAHLGDVCREIPGLRTDVSGMSPEEIYSRLPFNLYILNERARSKFLPDNDSYWDRKDDNGNSGILILDIPEANGMLRPSSDDQDADADGYNTKQIWAARAAAAEKASSGKGNQNGVGSMPEYLKRIIEKTKAATVDWKKILNNFIQERICDYSFSPPDRRYDDTDFFLPDFNEKEFVSREILFMVDTSGSVMDDDLVTVYSEIKGAIEQFDGKLCGKLGFFDVNVKTPLPFESTSDLIHIIPYGGGGTDFRPIFNYVRENYWDELPACIVIFTDGYGPYPAESAAMGIPVLWLINNPDITPPWGKTARILPIIKAK